MSKLWAKTLDLLKNTNIPLSQIHMDTGLTYGWLQSVKYGKGKRGQVTPSVEKAELLYEYLSGKTLVL